MKSLTPELIAAAKDNDLAAVSALIAATEPLIVSRAMYYATTKGATDYDLTDDLAQVGRVHLWQSLSEFQGTGRGEFINYVGRVLQTAMTRHRREVAYQGVSASTAKDFERAVELAGGDPYEAVRIATTDAMGTRVMTRERAYAALTSWLGVDSLERPIMHESNEMKEVTLRDVISAKSGIPADLLDSRDYESTRRRTVHERVHHALGELSERQRHVLKADHGITPVGFYGDVPDAELADDMGVTPYQVKQARVKGRSRFAALYLAGSEAAGATA